MKRIIRLVDVFRHIDTITNQIIDNLLMPPFALGFVVVEMFDEHEEAKCS